MIKSLPKGLVPALTAFGLAGITLVYLATAQTRAFAQAKGAGIFLFDRQEDDRAASR